MKVHYFFTCNNFQGKYNKSVLVNVSLVNSSHSIKIKIKQNLHLCTCMLPVISQVNIIKMVKQRINSEM